MNLEPDNGRSPQTVSVIGLGVVGGAMFRAFRESSCTVFGHDIDPARSHHSLEAALGQELILVSLPTPVDAQGNCDLAAVHALFDHADRLHVQGSLVLRSTVPVGTTRNLMLKHPRLKIGVSPEFLRGQSADADFLNPPFVLYGGTDFEPYFKAIDLVCRNSSPSKIVLTPCEAEVVKLFLNGFTALKTVFSSEMARLADSFDADWQKIVAAAGLDGRLGEGYLSATGPDHLPGFGGHCLPKDCRMLARQLGEDSVLESILRINERLRNASSAGNTPAP